MHGLRNGKNIMTCKANIPESLCETWQETESPECRGCDKNKVGYQGLKPTRGGAFDSSKSPWHNNNKRLFEPTQSTDQRGKYTRKTAMRDGCLFDGCGADAVCRGYCNYHYRKFLAGTLNAPAKATKCKCGADIKAKGLCQKCYDQAKWQKRKAKKVWHVKDGRVVA